MTDNDIRTAITRRGGFASLNAMQEAVLASNDNRLILLSPTGSGKTAAFAIFLLKKLSTPGRGLQALIVAPARELAQQIAAVLKQIMPAYRTVTLTGGHSLRDEVNRMQGALPDIVIATPGRLLDHLQRETVDVSAVGTLVIDEMDKCLDLGFLPDIKKILRALKALSNVMLTSATMPADEELLKLIGGARLLDFSTGNADKPDVEVIAVRSFDKDKLNTLASLLNAFGPEAKTIIFVNHRESAVRVHNSLVKRGFAASLYHGALEQQDRELGVAALRGGALPIMVATDLAARGLDIPQVENIVHYHLPTSAEAYTHRNGRTARAGASGSAYVIIHEEETLPEYIEAKRQFVPQAPDAEALNEATRSLLVFSIGKKDKISKGDVLGYLTKQLEIDGKDIGKIEVADRYSAVNVPVGVANLIMEKAQGTRLKNKRFRLDIY